MVILRYVSHHVKFKKITLQSYHVFLIITVSAVISLYSVTRLIFVVKTGCVSCAVGTEYLNIRLKNLRF